VDYLVDVVGCDTRLDLTRRDVQHLAAETADFPHSILLLLVENGDLSLRGECLFLDQHLLVDRLVLGCPPVSTAEQRLLY